MATKHQPVAKFQSDIEALIAEIETCMASALKNKDREFSYQHDAFRERCHQAKTLAERLGVPNRSEWSMRSGDAHRIEESLKLSLAYFRGWSIG